MLGFRNMQEKLENLQVCMYYLVHKNGEILNKLELSFKRIDFVPKGNRNCP